MNEDQMHRFLHGLGTLAYGVFIFSAFLLISLATTDAFLGTLVLSAAGLAYLTSATTHSRMGDSPALTAGVTILFFGSLVLSASAYARAVYLIWSYL